jgi:hypothetical protein
LCAGLQLDRVVVVIKNVITIAVKALDSSLFDIAAAVLRECLDPKCHVFARVGHPPAALEAIQYTEATPEWHASLRLMSFVDAQRLLANGIRVWNRGQITDENATRFLIAFVSPNGGQPFLSMWFPKNSVDLAPPGTKTPEFDDKFVSSLRPMSRVDCEDKNRRFFNATVLEVKTSFTGYKEVRIGLVICS